MQAFCCLEGPVAESYDNEIIMIGNPAYLTRETIQHLADDYLFVLIFTAKKGSKHICACSMFLPVATPDQLTPRKFDVTYQPLALKESIVQFDGNVDVTYEMENNTCQNGLPLEIVIPLDQIRIDVQLIDANENASVMVGYQVMIEVVVIVTHKLYHPFQLGNIESAEVRVSCKQISGHLSNDNK